MKYNPKTKSIEVSAENLDLVYRLIILAIQHIRELAHLPLDKYVREKGMLRPEDYAQRYILEIGDKLGIVMGAEWGEELDVRPE